MASDLFTLLVSFQPDAPELKQKTKYDAEVRAFINQLHSVNSSYFLKGADTPQDVLEVVKL